MRKMILCYKNRKGELKATHLFGFRLFVCLTFPFWWLPIIIDTIAVAFRNNFWITEEEYHKVKIKELKKD